MVFGVPRYPFDAWMQEARVAQLGTYAQSALGKIVSRAELGKLHSGLWVSAAIGSLRKIRQRTALLHLI